MPEPQPPRPWVKPSDLLLIGDVRRLCGVAPSSRHTIRRWRETKGFPEPIKAIRTGRGKRAKVVEIWDRRDVKAWLAENPPMTREIAPE